MQSFNIKNSAEQALGEERIPMQLTQLKHLTLVENFSALSSMQPPLNIASLLSIAPIH
jgi:hypothetical protein